MGVITLITDFGTRDWFVGTMKAVVLAIAPKATVVDVTHEVHPGDIRGGAFALAAAWGFFPKGTVHVAVIDPGVGSARKAVAVEAAGQWFVGPDNGVLSWAVAQQEITAIHALENAGYFLRPVSNTFHGRDIFAPVGAHLSRGVPIRKLGPKRRDLVRLQWPEVRARPGGVEGEVVYIDRFGNAITNLGEEDLRGAGWKSCQVCAGRQRRIPLNTFYQAVPAGRPVALIGASGFLEIAVNGGSAEKGLGLKIGTRVQLR